MIDHDAGFPAAYTVREADAMSGPPDVSFVAEGVSRSAPVFAIDVVGTKGRRWRGDVFGGRDPLRRLVNGAAPDVLLVIAGGVGYAVPADTPEAYAVLDLRPVTEVLPAVDAKLVICVGLTKVVAIGPDGSLVWTSSRVAADGISGARIGSHVVVVSGWDAPSHREVETTLDLNSGATIART